MAGVNESGCVSTMPYKDSVKRRESMKQWKIENAEKVKEQKKRWRKKKREKARAEKKRWREENKETIRERCRETKKKWRENNKDKVQAQNRKYREQHREACNEASRRYYQEHKEQRCETKNRWRENNKDKMAAYRRKYQQQHREACNEASRRYYQEHKEQRCETKNRWRENNKDKRTAYRRKYRQQQRCKVNKNPECHCKVCLSCGGWVVSWKPEWYARLNAWLVSLTKEPGSDEVDAQRVDRVDDLPAIELEVDDLPIIESEVETLSTVSTSEVDSEWGDRLETLLADESDSEVETGPTTAPTRWSARIAAKPPISYKESVDDPMLEILERKERLHSEVAERIVTRWELMWGRSHRVNTIVEDMAPIDPTRQLDRFHAQLEREDAAMDIMVDDELFDFFENQL